MDFLPRRLLGNTGIAVSPVAFGAGPVAELMVGLDRSRQRDVVGHAIARGINWFDTAATYGGGESERSLGEALRELHASSKVHVATKVRFMPDDLRDIRDAARRSLAGSLERLGLPRVTLLQLHNAITPRRGDQPTSVTPQDVLEPGGIAEAFETLRDEGRTLHLGLTGIGDPESLAEVVQSGRFETIQVPFHLLNPSAGRVMEPDFAEANYGNIIAACTRQQMGVMAIRVLAGGALADRPPSPHTLKTPFFPLQLYNRDRQLAAKLAAQIVDRRLAAEAIRFAVQSHPQIHAAIIGFADERQIDEALAALASREQPLGYDDVRACLPPNS
jgi:aryl-alcohol dehydrogenase-like predicted oxidoreductase